MNRIWSAATALLLLAFPLVASPYILENKTVINERASTKIEEIGAELFAKTGIAAYIDAKLDLGGKPMALFGKEQYAAIQAPFVVITFALKEQKIEIFQSPDTQGLFDKEQILSPYPWSGSIIPILSSKDRNDKESAALLNGYADLAEQIARDKGVTLASAIGDSNRNTIDFLRYIFYFVVIMALLVIGYHKIKKWKTS